MCYHIDIRRRPLLSMMLCYRYISRIRALHGLEPMPLYTMRCVGRSRVTLISVLDVYVSIDESVYMISLYFCIRYNVVYMR